MVQCFKRLLQHSSEPIVTNSVEFLRRFVIQFLCACALAPAIVANWMNEIRSLDGTDEGHCIDAAFIIDHSHFPLQHRVDSALSNLVCGYKGDTSRTIHRRGFEFFFLEKGLASNRKVENQNDYLNFVPLHYVSQECFLFSRVVFFHATGQQESLWLDCPQLNYICKPM